MIFYQTVKETKISLTRFEDYFTFPFDCVNQKWMWIETLHDASMNYFFNKLHQKMGKEI